MSDPKVRVAYLVPPSGAEGADGRVLAADDEHLSVEGVRAYKDVRVRARAVGAPGSFSVQWTRAPLYVPFNPPVNLDVQTVAEPGIDAPRLAAYALETLGVDVGAPILGALNDWAAFSRDVEPDASGEPADFRGVLSVLRGCDAFRASVNASTGELVAEAWFALREWHDDFEAPASIGVFSVKGLDAGGEPSSEPATARSVGPAAAHFLLSGREHRLGSQSGAGGEPVLLDLYPRHRPAALRAAARLAEPYGLHPFLELELQGDDAPPLPVCKLYAKLDLPRNVFVDQYELQDGALHGPPIDLVSLWGETDLEKPAWRAREGSTALFRLGGTGTYSVPLHFRYDMPTDALHVDGALPAPYVFWACKDPHMPARTEPFLDVSERLGVESVFPAANTVFYVAESNRVPYTIPTIGRAPEAAVVWLTLATVVGGTLCIIATIVQKVWARRQ